MDNIFKILDLEAQLNNLVKDVSTNIECLQRSTLLGIGEEKYTSFLFDKNRLRLPEMRLKDMTRTEKQIKDPSQPIVSRNRLQKPKFVYELTIYIPLEGEMSVLNKSPLICYKPTNSFISINDCYFNNDEILIKKIIRSNSESELLKNEISIIQVSLIQSFGLLHQDLSEFNDRLKSIIIRKFKEIKQRHLKAIKNIESLGLPLKRDLKNSLQVSATLRKAIKITEPTLNEPYKPEPYIGLDVYNQIITLINDSCKNIERMPSLFLNRHENDLRDFILFVLDPNFKLGSATGETFNTKGKTDILLRHSSTNVFVAECKFWKGAKSYSDAIDQLLGYLTWRDSKAALIIFVKQKKISEVIKTIIEVAPKHSNFISKESSNDDGIIRCKFHLNGDDNREIWLTTMIYHTPREN